MYNKTSLFNVFSRFETAVVSSIERFPLAVVCPALQPVHAVPVSVAVAFALGAEILLPAAGVVAVARLPHRAAVRVRVEGVAQAVVIAADKAFLAVGADVAVALILAAEVGGSAAAPALDLTGRVTFWVQHACRRERGNAVATGTMML